MDRTNNILNTQASLFWLATAGYMGFIFYLSSRSSFNVSFSFDNIDKVVHILIYMPLAFLFYSSLSRSGIRKYLFVTAFAVAVMYGVSDEVHQFFVEGRDASIADLFADMFGAFLGCSAAFFIEKETNEALPV